MTSHKMKKKGARVIALFTLIAFVSTNLSYGAVSLPLGSAEAKVKSLAQTIEIPEKIGSVEDRQISVEPTATTILHIQDAHASLEAQHNIQAILSHLQKNYGTDLVFLEGAVGELRTERLKFFKDERLNDKAAELFARRALIGGTELYLLKEEREGNSSAGRGIEDPVLYRRNLADFRAVLSRQSESKEFLRDLKSLIFTRASQLFSKDLKTFFRECAFYQETEGEALRHLTILDQTAKGKMGLDFRDPFTQIEWPQLVRWARLKDLEGKIDPTKVEAERKELKKWITRILTSSPRPPDTGGRGNDKIFKNFQKLWDAVANPAIKIQSPRLMAEHFYEEASAHGFRFEDYPELSKALGRIILTNEIKGPKLFDEMQHLTEKILQHLARQDKTMMDRLVEFYRDDRAASKMLEFLIHDLKDLKVKYLVFYDLHSAELTGGRPRSFPLDFTEFAKGILSRITIEEDYLFPLLEKLPEAHRRAASDQGEEIV